MAQPTITSAAHSTQHSTSRATRAKKKKIRAMYIAVGSTVLMAIAIGTGVWAYRTSKKDKMVTPPTTSHATGAASDLQAPDSTQPATAQIREHPEGRPAPHTPRRATLQEDKTSTTPSVHRSPSNVRTPSSTSHKPLPPLPDSPLPDSPPPELNDGFLGSTPPHRDAGSDVSPGTEAKYIRNCLLFYQMLFGKNYYNKSSAELKSARKPFWGFIKSFKVAPGLTDGQAIEQMRAQYIPLAEQHAQDLFAYTTTSPEQQSLPRAEPMQPKRLAFGSAAGGGTAGASKE